MPSAPPLIVLRLFGTPDLRTATDARAQGVLAHSKHLAFLAISAVARRSPVRRDRMLGLLWPESDEDRARNALSKAIHNCRRVLGDEALLERFAEDVGLRVDRWSVDLWDFEDAVQRGAHAEALDLYSRGEFLEGFHIPDASALEHWLDGERQRLRRLAIESAGALADFAERTGDVPAATSHWRLACLLSPFDERLVRQRMEFHARHADRAGAVSAFTDFAARLQRELDASPSPETVALIESIRQREDAIETGALAGLAVPSRNGGVAPDRERLSPRSMAAVDADSAESAPQPSRRRYAPWLLVGAIAVLLTLWVKLGDADVASAASAVVVIPFENQTADSSLTTFGEMAADRLSLGLSRAGIADVIDGRARVRQGLSVASPGFIQDSEQLVALAREQGAGTIVTGRYYRAGNSLYVIAQIQDADGKTGRFAEEAGPVGDPQELLRRVEQRLLGVIASTRDPRMTAATSGALSYPTYAAYSQYVEGLRAWAASDSRTAAPHFLRAMELDSTFVAVIPLLHNALHMTGRGEQADSILVALGARRDSLPAADRALIDWTTAWMNGRREDMFEAAQQWVTATPRSPDALWYLAFSAVTTNRYVMAADLFSRIDLQNGWTRQSVFASVRWQTTALHFQGRYRDEQALARETRERHPQDPEGCAYETRAMAPRASLAQLTRTLADCPGDTGIIDSSRMWDVRQVIVDELRAHGREDDAKRFAQPAVAWYREQFRREPDSKRRKEQLGIALLQVGAWSEALPLFEGEARLPANAQLPRWAANAAIAAAHIGKKALAEDLLAYIRERTPGSNFHRQRARILAHLDRKEEAVAELREGVQKGLAPVEVYHADFGLDPLRGFPAYEALFAPRN